MKSKQEYWKEYKLFVKKEREVSNQREKLLSEFAKDYCPYKIGQQVSIRGYSYKDKQGIIKRIFGTNKWDEELSWRVIAIVLKADGTESKLYARWGG